MSHEYPVSPDYVETFVKFLPPKKLYSEAIGGQAASHCYIYRPLKHLLFKLKGS